MTKPTEIYAELHGKRRVIEYTVHLMVAGKAAPKQFYYNTKVADSGKNSAAQKAADKKYAGKISGKYKPFIVNLTPDEFASIDEVIVAAGMKKPTIYAGRSAN